MPVQIDRFLPPTGFGQRSYDIRETSTQPTKPPPSSVSNQQTPVIQVKRLNGPSKLCKKQAKRRHNPHHAHPLERFIPPAGRTPTKAFCRIPFPRKLIPRLTVKLPKKDFSPLYCSSCGHGHNQGNQINRSSDDLAHITDLNRI